MDDSERSYTAALIIIGNEVLSGRVQDANLNFLARELKALGIRLREARVIPDVPETIVDTVNVLRSQHDYVFTTGGIGPTHDDITSESVARAFGVPWERNEEAEQILREYYGDDVNEARLRMATIPRGGRLLHNPVSRAPGFNLGNVYVLPGVPRILQAIFAGFKHELTGGRPLRSKTITAPVPESYAAAGLQAVQEKYPQAEIGSYPFFHSRGFGTAIVVRAVDEVTLERATTDVAALVRSLGEEPVITEGEGPSPRAQE